MLARRLPAAWLRMLVAALVLGSAVLAGCGPETGGRPVKQVPPDEPRIGPPAVKESLPEVEQRIAAAANAKDCQGIYELVPTSRPSAASKQRCEFNKRLAGLDIVGSEEYEDMGAVIDYDNGPAFATAVMIRDDDGLYHLAVLDFTVDEPATETEFNGKAFNEAALAAVEAIRDRDCEPYTAILSRQFGLGSAPEPEICPKLERESNTFANSIQSDTLAEPELLGGNGTWAFYGLSTAFGYYILLFTHQPPTPTAPDAAEYAFVDGYLVNQRDSE
jgi:hypothetical protein